MGTGGSSRRRASTNAPSRLLELQILVWPRIRVARDQADPGLLHARADAGHGAQLVDGYVHDVIVQDALDLVEQGLALRAIHLVGLTLEQILDLGEDAVRVEPDPGHIGLEPGRRVSAG